MYIDSENNAIEEFDEQAYLNRTQPVSLFLLTLIIPLVTMSISIGSIAIYAKVVIGLGILSGLAYLLDILKSGFRLPREIWLFSAFLFWAFLGAFKVVYFEIYLAKMVSLLQFLVLIILISHYARDIKSAYLVLGAIFIGILIVMISGYITGEYQQAERSDSVERVAGLAGNANIFSLVMVYGLAIVLCFFKMSKSWLLKGASVVMMLIFVKMIIASGSREGFICMVVLVGSWFFLTYGKELFRRPAVALAAGLATCLLMVFMFQQLAGSELARRFTLLSTLFEGGTSVGHSTDTRLAMIKTGLGFLFANPVLGIGLNQFMIKSGFGMYAHNNYVEVFASTGFIGGICYYSIYAVLWFRIRKLKKYPFNEKTLALLTIAQAILLVRVAGDMARITYYMKLNWVVLALFIGFTYNLEQRVKELYSNVPNEPAPDSYEETI